MIQSMKYATGTVKRGRVTAFAGPGRTEAVAAVTGKKIRVLSFMGNSDSLQSMFWESATTRISSDILAASLLQALWPYLEVGWFETAKGEALNLNKPGGSGFIDVEVRYVEVD